MEVGLVLVSMLCFGGIGFFWAAIVELHRRAGSLEKQKRAIEFPYTVLRSPQFMSTNQKAIFFTLIVVGFFCFVGLVAFPFRFTSASDLSAAFYLFIAALPLMVAGKLVHSVLFRGKIRRQRSSGGGV